MRPPSGHKGFIFLQKVSSSEPLHQIYINIRYFCYTFVDSNLLLLICIQTEVNNIVRACKCVKDT